MIPTNKKMGRIFDEIFPDFGNTYTSILETYYLRNIIPPYHRPFLAKVVLNSLCLPSKKELLIQAQFLLVLPPFSREWKKIKIKDLDNQTSEIKTVNTVNFTYVVNNTIVCIA